jgi:hypothetical protein
MNLALQLSPTLLTVMVIGLLSSSCEKATPSFHFASDEQHFLVSPDLIEVPAKIDVLWVIDNSGSMATSQNHLAENFPRFIQNFSEKKYDFRIAVTTTDAYRGRFTPAALSKRNLRPSLKGELFLTPQSENLVENFIHMALVGINGYGDERAFQSIEDVLTHPGNSEFRRSDAYLAIIILSDEDDFSNPTTAFLDPNYDHPSITPVSYYHNLLTEFSGGASLFGVYSISILTDSCRTSLEDNFTERKVARRYHELVQLSGGVNASLCEDFSSSLKFISDVIIKKNPPTTTYLLRREPKPESILVTINGNTISEDSLNGWSYNLKDWSISLSGLASSLIQDGGEIKITYDPKNPFDK